jgi:hypothetical protein
LVAPEIQLEPFELSELLRFDGQGAHLGERSFEQRQCPAPLKFLFRCQLMARFQRELAFARQQVERFGQLPAAAFLGPGAAVLVGEEMIERGEQERAEFPPSLVGDAQGALFQQLRKELLGQVLSFMFGMPAAAHMGVERVPIRFAEFGQSLPGIGRLVSAGRQNQAPMRRGKPAGTFGPRIGGRRHKGILRRRPHVCTPGLALSSRLVSRSLAVAT